MEKSCVFAEWCLGHIIDRKNGGYFVHHKSGLETNKAYSIVELFELFDKPKQVPSRELMNFEIKALKKCCKYMTSELLEIHKNKKDIAEMHRIARANCKIKNNLLNI